MSPIKSSTLSLSGRSSNTGADVNEVNASVFQPSFVALAAIIGFREFLRVFLLCPKAVLTMFLNAFSSQPRDVRLFLVSLITADCTLGGGANAPEPTVNKYSMSYQAWRSTAVGLGTRLLCDAFCHFFLYHADCLRNTVAVVDDTEKYLR